MITLNGSNFNSSGKSVTLDPGTYPCTLRGANMYMNNKYQSEETQRQITLIWDTGFTAENEDGEEVDAIIYDSFLNFSFNEKAKLTERVASLIGAFDARAAAIGIKLDGISNFDELTHFKDGRTDVTDLLVNDKNLWGLEALVTIVHNDKGYAKVTSVTAPIAAAPQGGKLRPRAAAAAVEAPLGIPT